MGRWAIVALVIIGPLLGGIGFLAYPWLMAERAPPPQDPPPPVYPIVAGTRLTIPRDLFRFENQARDGEAPRLDLALRWPGPRAVGAIGPDDLPNLIFISLVPKDEALDPPRRFAAIHARFLEAETRSEGFSLGARRFREGSGYDGEDLVYDIARPGAFFVRCAPSAGEAPAICLRELRLGDTMDVSIRFPRALLADWRRLDQTLRAFLSAIGAPPAP